MPNFTFAHLTAVQEKHRAASKVAHMLESNAGIMKAEKDLAEEWQAMGWKAFEASLQCTCGKPHFSNVTQPGEGEPETELQKVIKKLALDWNRLRDELEKIYVLDTTKDRFERLQKELKDFWGRYSEAVEGTYCDKQSFFAVNLAVIIPKKKT